jgi:hypothetical protein
MFDFMFQGFVTATKGIQALIVVLI